MKYFDEMAHIELPAGLVRAARAEDIKYFNNLPVWDIVRTQECWGVTGKPLISPKWVDVNKGDQESYEVRRRLVAREMGEGRTTSSVHRLPNSKRNDCYPVRPRRAADTGRQNGSYYSSTPEKLTLTPRWTARLKSSCQRRWAGPVTAAGSTDACMALGGRPPDGK